MDRIIVVGCTGSGKTTFSKALAGKLGYPMIELDRLSWLPDWKPRPDPEFFELIKESVAQPQWVLDGNYNRTWDLTWPLADTYIWLDYPFPLVLYRSLKRVFVRSFTQEEFWPGTGNRESLKMAFLSRESILLWMLKSYPNLKKRYRSIFAKDSQEPKKHIRFGHPKEARKFLESSSL